MEKIKIYLHGEGGHEPQIIELDENSSVHEIIIKHHEITNSGGTVVDDEIDLILEDEDECKQKGDTCKDAGIKHRHHVHCHRCKLIDISLEYNGQLKKINLSPAATGSRILRKAAAEFNITEGDAADLKIELPGGTEMETMQHIGSFVSYPACNIKLVLKSGKKVEG